MLQRLENSNLVWNHIQKPTKKDWDFIEKNIDIPTNIILEMTDTIQQPRVEQWDNNLYININVPLFNRIKQTTETGDLHIILTESTMTTIVFKANMPVKSIFHHATKSKRFKNELMQKNGGILLIKFIEELMSLSFDKIKHINENIDWIKETLFEEGGYNHVQDISKVKLDILMFQRILKPQKNILNTILSENFNQFNEPSLKALIRELIRINIKVWNSIESAQEIIESLEITNNSMVSFRLNNTMRFLAAVSLITFAMSVTLGIFSIIPFGSFQSAHSPGMFLVAMFMLLLVTLVSFLFFRRKKWL
jgi:Mg2+ and Co2+ transporter CorA